MEQGTDQVFILINEVVASVNHGDKRVELKGKVLNFWSFYVLTLTILILVLNLDHDQKKVILDTRVQNDLPSWSG